MIRERSISTVSQPSMMSSSYSSSMSRKTSSYRQTKNMSSRSEKEFLVEKIINFTNKECSDKVKSKLRVEDESNIRTLINNIFKASENNPDIKKIYDDFKDEIANNPNSNTFTKYSQIFNKLKKKGIISNNISDSFIALYVIYNYYNSGLHNITYNFSESSNIIVNNIFKYINNKNYNFKDIDSYYHYKIYMFLLIKFLNIQNHR